MAENYGNFQFDFLECNSYYLLFRSGTTLFNLTNNDYKTMKLQPCQKCGCSEFSVSEFLRRDFPSGLYFIRCSNCGMSERVVGFRNAVDTFRSRSVGEKKIARELLSAIATEQTV